MSPTARSLALLLVGCAGSADETVDGSSATEVPCVPSDTPALELGADGASFEPWSDGDVIDVVDDPTGYGFELAYRVTGLEDDSQATALIRISLSSGSTTDYPAFADLACAGDGSAYWKPFARLPDEWQDGAVGSLAGTEVSVGTSLTDTESRTAYQELVLEIGSTPAR